MHKINRCKICHQTVLWLETKDSFECPCCGRDINYEGLCPR